MITGAYIQSNGQNVDFFINVINEIPTSAIVTIYKEIENEDNNDDIVRYENTETVNVELTEENIGLLIYNSYKLYKGSFFSSGEKVEINVNNEIFTFFVNMGDGSSLDYSEVVWIDSLSELYVPYHETFGLTVNAYNEDEEELDITSLGNGPPLFRQATGPAIREDYLGYEKILCCRVGMSNRASNVLVDPDRHNGEVFSRRLEDEKPVLFLISGLKKPTYKTRTLNNLMPDEAYNKTYAVWWR